MPAKDTSKITDFNDHDFLALGNGGWAMVRQVGGSIRYQTFDAKGESDDDSVTLISNSKNLDHIDFRGATRNDDGSAYVLFTARNTETGVVGLYSQVFDRDLQPFDRKPLLLSDTHVPQANEQTDVVALARGAFLPSWYVNEGSNQHSPHAFIQDPDGDIINAGVPTTGWSEGPTDMDVATLNGGKFVAAYEINGAIYVSLMRLSGNKNADGTYDVRTLSWGRAENLAYEAKPHHRDVSITGLTNGNFVVTYERFYPHSDDSILYQRVFDKDGKVIDLGLIRSSEKSYVGTYANYHQYDADTAGLSDGGWATVWRTRADDETGNQQDIYLKAYSADGFGKTEDIKINTGSGNCKAPEVTALENGNVLVTWTQHGDLQQRLVDLSGNAIYGIDENSAVGDYISGTGHRDQIFGLSGYDTIVGAGGDDVIDGGAGTDTMRGGKGNDIYIIDRLDDIIIEGRHGGHDTVKTALSLSLESYKRVENVKLMGVLDLDVDGSRLDNRMAGNSGDNKLSGLAGNDIIDGRQGFDTLTGGTGRDVFVFQAGSDRDVITDFEFGRDKIDLSAFSDIHSIADLTISRRNGDDLLIKLGGDDAVVLGNIGNHHLTDHQFMFSV